MPEEPSAREENGLVSFFDHSSFFMFLLLLCILATGLFVVWF